MLYWPLVIANMSTVVEGVNVCTTPAIDNTLPTVEWLQPLVEEELGELELACDGDALHDHCKFNWCLMSKTAKVRARMLGDRAGFKERLEELAGRVLHLALGLPDDKEPDSKMVRDFSFNLSNAIRDLLAKMVTADSEAQPTTAPASTETSAPEKTEAEKRAERAAMIKSTSMKAHAEREVKKKARDEKTTVGLDDRPAWERWTVRVVERAKRHKLARRGRHATDLPDWYRKQNLEAAVARKQAAEEEPEIELKVEYVCDDCNRPLLSFSRLVEHRQCAMSCVHKPKKAQQVPVDVMAQAAPAPTARVTPQRYDRGGMRVSAVPASQKTAGKKRKRAEPSSEAAPSDETPPKPKQATTAAITSFFKKGVCISAPLCLAVLSSHTLTCKHCLCSCTACHRGGDRGGGRGVGRGGGE